MGSDVGELLEAFEQFVGGETFLLRLGLGVLLGGNVGCDSQQSLNLSGRRSFENRIVRQKPDPSTVLVAHPVLEFS